MNTNINEAYKGLVTQIANCESEFDFENAKRSLEFFFESYSNFEMFDRLLFLFATRAKELNIYSL